MSYEFSCNLELEHITRSPETRSLEYSLDHKITPSPDHQIKMQERFFNCPYCWEEISVLLDPSVSEQNYVEDCEICCSPIRFYVKFENRELVLFEAEREQ